MEVKKDKLRMTIEVRNPIEYYTWRNNGVLISTKVTTKTILTKTEAFKDVLLDIL